MKAPVAHRVEHERHPVLDGEGGVADLRVADDPGGVRILAFDAEHDLLASGEHAHARCARRRYALRRFGHREVLDERCG
jgi:hypothetical protein